MENVKTNGQTLKIIEWNVNHRAGGGQNGKEVEYPDWVNVEIHNRKADIAILTEFFSDTQKLQNALGKDYKIYKSINEIVNNVVIAVNTQKIEVLKCKTIVGTDNNDDIPETLCLHCKMKANGKYFIVCGVRIKTIKNYAMRKRQFEIFLNELYNSIATDVPVIIGGDFNNNKRDTVEKDWSLAVIDSVLNKHKFKRETPEGSSLWEDVNTNAPRCFAEDHFLVKNIEVVPKTLTYDRNFVHQDSQIYKWGKDFQKDLGKGQYEHIPTPFPDHAIIEAEIIIDLGHAEAAALHAEITDCKPEEV